LRQEDEEKEDQRGNRTGKISVRDAERDTEQQRHNTQCCDESTHKPTFWHDSIISDNSTFETFY
jgi:hypothetical protein